MRYIMLVYETAADLDSRDDPTGDPYVAAWRAYHKALVEANVYVGGAPLKQAATATTVRLREGRRQVQDGPFAEAKEVLGGFNLIEAEDMDEAVRIASHFPWVQTGCVEIRPVRDIGAVRHRVGAPPAGAAASRP